MSFTHGCMFWMQKLQHWVISIRLQVKPFSVVHLKQGTAGMRGFSRVLVSGWLSKERKEMKTPSQPVKCKTQNICTYLQIIAFLTRNQSKTFLSTQIHKCKRSVNRLFKGYLLIIYMKHRCDYPLWCWPLKLNCLIKLIITWLIGMNGHNKHDVPLKQTK